MFCIFFNLLTALIKMQIIIFLVYFICTVILCGYRKTPAITDENSFQKVLQLLWLKTKSFKWIGRVEAFQVVSKAIYQVLLEELAV